MNIQTNKEFYQGAMYNGTILGAVWSIMYLMLFTGITNMMSLLLVTTLYIASPFIAAKLAIKFRSKECNNTMSYIQAWSFLLYMYICATLLSALTAFVYFEFLDGGAFFMTLQSILEETKQIAGTDELLIQQIEQTSNIIDQTTTNGFVWQIMNNNFFNTTILPIIIAVFVKRKE
jgi:hypothetical protein